MKNIILLLSLFVLIKTNAQDLRKYYPFKYDNKWGIVDSTQEEIVKPQYKDINIINDFTYAEFDAEIIYNLKTGESFPAFGKYCSTIHIDSVAYYLFTNDKKSTLISFETQDTIKLSLRYKYMTEQTFYLQDSSALTKASSLIFGHLYNDDEEILVLNADKNLNSFIRKRLDAYHLELIENKKYKTIGLVTKIDNYLFFYDHNLDLIKKIANTKGDDYDLMSRDISIRIPEFYKIKDAQTGCYSCESIWDSSWSLENELTNNVSDNPNNNNYFLTLNSREYFLNSSKDPEFKLKIYLDYLSYPSEYQSISIRDLKAVFFYDKDYMNTEKIMFPEKYLIKKD